MRRKLSGFTQRINYSECIIALYQLINALITKSLSTAFSSFDSFKRDAVELCGVRFSQLHIIPAKIIISTSSDFSSNLRITAVK